MARGKEHPLGYAEMAEALQYDPDTGIITWKIRPSRRNRAGDEAGLIKVARIIKGIAKRYRYVTYKGYSTTSARIAWLLTHKEWPLNNILYIDGDTLNVRIDNLKLGDFCYGREDGVLKRNKMTKAAQRHYGLKRYYGLTSDQYGKMLADQAGVCSICGEPEVRVTMKGELTTLHVDHCHDTNKVRSLLCYRCNSGLGSFRDRVDLLRKAAEYIEFHRNE